MAGSLCFSKQGHLCKLFICRFRFIFYSHSSNILHGKFLIAFTGIYFLAFVLERQIGDTSYNLIYQHSVNVFTVTSINRCLQSTILIYQWPFFYNSTLRDFFFRIQLLQLCTISHGLWFSIFLLCIFLPFAYFELLKVDNLNATASQQAMVTGLLSLPWALKIGCGFLSDSFPIGQYVCIKTIISSIFPTK